MGAVFLGLALVLTLVPNTVREQIASLVRATVLRPVFALQRGAAERNVVFDDPVRLRAERDSLASYLVGHAAMATENRQLRELLSLHERLVPNFVPAELVRISGATEGYFQLTAGADQGIAPGASIVAAHGLVGRVLEVDSGISFGMDWMHHEFRASAMTVDGEVYGIAVPRRVDGEAMLVLTGAPRHVELDTGTLIVTSGHGGVFPRGIPIGSVEGLENTEEDWQRNYVIRPAVLPTEMAYVLVLGEARRTDEEEDFASYWGIRAVEPEPAPAVPPVSAGPSSASPPAVQTSPPTAPAQEEPQGLPGVEIQPSEPQPPDAELPQPEN